MRNKAHVPTYHKILKYLLNEVWFRGAVGTVGDIGRRISLDHAAKHLIARISIKAFPLCMCVMRQELVVVVAVSSAVFPESNPQKVTGALENLVDDTLTLPQRMSDFRRIMMVVQVPWLHQRRLQKWEGHQIVRCVGRTSSRTSLYFRIACSCCNNCDARSFLVLWSAQAHLKISFTTLGREPTDVSRRECQASHFTTLGTRTYWWPRRECQALHFRMHTGTQQFLRVLQNDVSTAPPKTCCLLAILLQFMYWPRQPFRSQSI